MPLYVFEPPAPPPPPPPDPIIPWEAPGAIGSSIPNAATFTNVSIQRNDVGTVQSFQAAPGGMGYRFQLFSDDEVPKLRLQSFFGNGDSFETLFTSEIHGETFFNVPLRLRFPPVVPVMPNFSTGDAYYFGRGIFFLPGPNNTVRLAYAFDGRVFVVEGTEVTL